MPVRGPLVAVSVQRIGSVGLVTVQNRTGHIERLTLTGATDYTRYLTVAGNDVFRTAIPLGDAHVRVVDERGSTLFDESTKES